MLCYNLQVSNANEMLAKKNRQLAASRARIVELQKSVVSGQQQKWSNGKADAKEEQEQEVQVCVLRVVELGVCVRVCVCVCVEGGEACGCGRDCDCD